MDKALSVLSRLAVSTQAADGRTALTDANKKIGGIETRGSGARWWIAGPNLEHGPDTKQSAYLEDQRRCPERVCVRRAVIAATHRASGSSFSASSRATSRSRSLNHNRDCVAGPTGVGTQCGERVDDRH